MKRIVRRIFEKIKDELQLGLSRRLAKILLCVFAFFGVYFLVLSPLTNDGISIDKALPSKGIYEGCNFVYSSKSHIVDMVEIFFSHGQSRIIQVPCITQKLLDEIEHVPKGAQLEMLLHPSSNSILMLSVDGKTLLDFDESSKRMTQKASAERPVGVVLLLLAMLMAARLTIGDTKAAPPHSLS